MDGDVVFFRCGGEGKRVILPDGHLWAAEEDVLSCSRFGVLFLDLDLADVAGVLHDFANERLVPASDLAEDTFKQIDESAVHPVRPKDAAAIAKGRDVCLDHAERAVDGPENEENDEEVMQIPEALKIGTTRFLNRCTEDDHQRCEHNVARPARPGCEVCSKEALESLFVLCRELGKIVPVRNCVDPGEEDNRVSYQLVEGDVLI